jgi:hypothetical protein
MPGRWSLYIHRSVGLMDVAQTHLFAATRIVSALIFAQPVRPSRPDAIFSGPSSLIRRGRARWMRFPQPMPIFTFSNRSVTIPLYGAVAAIS